MESGHKSGGGASGGGGLCNACGYQYPNAHPSAKQRRAHRKNCGKPPSAAVEEGSGERDGKKLLLGEGEGGGGVGEGNGERAADCGGGSPGSAREVGDVVENEDHAEHSSPNGTGVQDIINKFSEDCLISCDDIPSEIGPKDNGIDNDEIQTLEDTRFSENAPHLDDGLPFSSDWRQDSSTSVLPPEPVDGARFHSDFSVDEINNSNVAHLTTNATAGEVSAQTNAIDVCPNDIAVAEVDGMINTIGKGKTSEYILVKGSEIDSSCQEKPQTKIDEGHSATKVEEDPYANNFNVVSKEEIPDEETESKEQSRLILTNSIEQVSTIKEPVNLSGNEESCTEKLVCANFTIGDDLFEVATGGCNLEAPDSVKTQQQTDSTSVATDQLAIPKQMDIEEGQHCPDADGVIIQAVSSIGPAVGAEFMSAGSAANLTNNVCSSEVTTGDGTRENVSHTSGTTLMPSQVDLAELDTYPTSHEIDMVSSKDGVEENTQNVNTSAELTSHVIHEVRSIDVEEKQHVEDTTACTSSHEANAVCGTGNFGENKQSEEIIAEADSHKISIVESTSSAEEKEQIKEVIANPSSNKIDVISSRDIVEEKKQSEVYVETTNDIIVACSIENVEGKRQNEEITADPTCEINAVNIPSNVELKEQNEETTRDPTACEINMANITDNVEEKKQNEEITTDLTHSINVICSPDSEDKKPNEDMTEGPSSHEIIVVHGTDNVKEKNEDTMSDPTSYQIAVSAIDSVEKKQNEEITADPTSGGINVVHTIDNVEGKKNGEPTPGPTSRLIDAESNTDVVEEKRQNEEIVADPSSHENGILQGTDNAEEKTQNEEVDVAPASDKTAMAQVIDDTEEKKHKKETAGKEINTTQSTDDLKGNNQNEEIADKEVIVDSDKNHVSLKVLLAEKGVETKEKKASTKDGVFSFRRRASKDDASPVKPGSPKAGSGHQDWNSPARLPIEKKPKGKKQQWLSFICCPAIN